MKLGIHCNHLGHVEERIAGNRLHHGEFYNFRREDLPNLKHWLLDNNIAMSIHTPLARVDWYPRPPTWSFLCDPDKEKRELNIKLVIETLDYAEEFGAQYIVVHFPAPPQSDISYLSDQKLRDTALGSADGLAELSARRKIPIHIEGFGPSPFLSTEFLIEVLGQYTSLSYCFDSAHMKLSALRDGFDYFGFLEQIAPYVASVHLWNTRGPQDYEDYRHIPVHPSQKREEGWVDIPRVIDVLKPIVPSATVILESSERYPPALGGYDYRDGVEWVRQLLKE
ncbi:MAG: sugar phosphate isomerase/epimerase [Chloroflexi bacterium]|nr:sugar phosphate isomerase/epimerase [Chloroflexota bacterium]